MIYFVSEQDCVIATDEGYVEIKANVKYVLNEIENNHTTIISKMSAKMIAVNFHDIIFKNQNNRNIKVCRYKNDVFCFLKAFEEKYCFSFHVFEDCLNIDIYAQIVVKYKGNEKSIKFENEIKFSHIEYFEKIAVIFFEGKKNMAVIVDRSQILYVSYYDKINLEERGCTVLSNLNDSINHGRVAKIENGKFESYLVYLDNNDMNLKVDFCMHVFLDCVMAGNFKYLQNLLDNNLKTQTDNLKLFFKESIDFFPIDKSHSMIFKKDAQVDIFEFDIIENKITNITVLD